MDSLRFIPLLRSKWQLEVMATQTAAAQGGERVPPQQRFICRPLGEQLVIALACDLGDSYAYVEAADLVPLGLKAAAAFSIAWSNFIREAIDGSGDVRFESMPEFGWIPSTAGTDECVTLLAQAESIRALPVAGRHLAFIPNTRGFWITGTENQTGIALLCAIIQNEYEDAEGKPISMVPQVLDGNGQWQPWLPPPDHPSYWDVRALHVRYLDQIYEEQRQMLRSESCDLAGDAHVAKFSAHAYGKGELEVLFSSCVWADVEALLPKTDLVEIKPLLNRAAVERADGVEPQFGETIPIAWDKLLSVLGNRVQTMEMFPRRYRVRPCDPAMLNLLCQARLASPEELFPGLKRIQREPAGASPKALVGSHPKPPGNSRVLLVLGLLGGGMLLFFGCGLVAIIMAARTISVVASGATPPVPAAHPQNALPQGEPGFNAEQQQTANAAMNAIVQAMDKMAKVQGADAQVILPLSFPELPIPEMALPTLEYEDSTTRSVEDAREDSVHAFRDEAPRGAWLVGFRGESGRHWGGVIQALQPIYQKENEYIGGSFIGVRGGKTRAVVLARPGYAVSGIEIQRGLVFNAVRVRFSRVIDARFNLDDSYQGPWVGLADSRRTETISGEGLPIVGIAGNYSGECFGDLSLLQALVTDNPFAE